MPQPSHQDAQIRGDLLLGLVFCAVTGFNLVLLFHHATKGNWGWFTLILLVCVLFPGLVPYFNFVRAVREGRLKNRWQEPFALIIGAFDSVAILSHWPDALIDVSWVSTFIIGTAAAFLFVVHSQ